MRFSSIFATLFKILAAGLIGTLFFSTAAQTERVSEGALALAITLVLGVGFIYVLKGRHSGAALRWGYFRLVLPLGVIYALVINWASIVALMAPKAVVEEQGFFARTLNAAANAFDGLKNIFSGSQPFRVCSNLPAKIQKGFEIEDIGIASDCYFTAMDMLDQLLAGFLRIFIPSEAGILAVQIFFSTELQTGLITTPIAVALVKSFSRPS